MAPIRWRRTSPQRALAPASDVTVTFGRPRHRPDHPDRTPLEHTLAGVQLAASRCARLGVPRARRAGGHVASRSGVSRIRSAGPRPSRCVRPPHVGGLSASTLRSLAQPSSAVAGRVDAVPPAARTPGRGGARSRHPARRGVTSSPRSHKKRREGPASQQTVIAVGGIGGVGGRGDRADVPAARCPGRRLTGLVAGARSLARLRSIRRGDGPAGRLRQHRSIRCPCPGGAAGAVVQWDDPSDGKRCGHRRPGRELGTARTAGVRAWIDEHAGSHRSSSGGRCSCTGDDRGPRVGDRGRASRPALQLVRSAGPSGVRPLALIPR